MPSIMSGIILGIHRLGQGRFRRAGCAHRAADCHGALRPYTLVLTKTDELFTREKDARHIAVTDLAWLTSAWGDGSPGMS